jgi:hypothetical protein
MLKDKNTLAFCSRSSRDEEKKSFKSSKKKYSHIYFVSSFFHNLTTSLANLINLYRA